jgi:hypothetical protein
LFQQERIKPGLVVWLALHSRFRPLAVISATIGAFSSLHGIVHGNMNRAQGATHHIKW